MSTDSRSAPATDRRRGRAYFWAGIGLVLLGILLCVVQYSLKQLVVPWYLPALTTLGALALLYSIVRRRTIVRMVALALIAALGTFEWFVVASATLPAYEGPAQAGRKFPAFSTTLADGRAFTEQELAQGDPTVMVFFRGRW